MNLSTGGSKLNTEMDTRNTSAADIMTKNNSNLLSSRQSEQASFLQRRINSIKKEADSSIKNMTNKEKIEL